MRIKRLLILQDTHTLEKENDREKPESRVEISTGVPVFHSASGPRRAEPKAQTSYSGKPSNSAGACFTYLPTYPPRLPSPESIAPMISGKS